MLAVQITDSTTGLGAVLTGGTLWFTAKTARSLVDASATFQKLIASGIVLSTQSGSTLGQATITIAPVDTTALSASVNTVLYYDLKYKDAAGVEVVLEEGSITVKAGVTQTF